MADELAAELADMSDLGGLDASWFLYEPPPLVEEPLCICSAAAASASRKGRRKPSQASATAGPPPPILATEAHNAYVAPISQLDDKKLARLRHIIESLKATGKHECEFRPQKLRFHVETPNWKSDIQWISSADEHTFKTLFKSLWDSLGIAKLFSFLGDLEMFSGFFVVRQTTRKSTWHTDFSDTGGCAWTLMTPLYDMTSLKDCHLVCSVPEPPHPLDTSEAATSPASKDRSAGNASNGDALQLQTPSRRMPSGRIKQYRYAVGEAIVFGDNFEHATQTGSSPKPLAFLCFTFGDRKCTHEQWENALAYIKEQGPIYCTPSGVLVGVA